MPKQVKSHFGYAGKVLEVDLLNRKIKKKSLDRNFVLQYIGGMGFGTRILYDRVGPKVDPLSPENLMIIATGPLVGTLAPSSSRIDFTFKSPLTGIFGTSNAGGFWGPELKYAGYDLLIVSKKAKEPVYIWIENDNVEIRNASHLWGKCDTWATTDVLTKELRDGTRIMAIGPAGENLVRYASVTVDYHRSASRCGVGAVMGSKNLKAIAVRGDHGIAVSRPDEFKKTVMECTKRQKVVWREEVDKRRSSSGLDCFDEFVRFGGLPCRNYQLGMLPNSPAIATAASFVGDKKGGACQACETTCGYIHIDEGTYSGVKLTDLHPCFYLDWGAKCALDNFPAMWKCVELSERLGMDSVSLSGSIAFAMELYQRGIIGKVDTDGLKLNWGNEESIITLIHRISQREGFGDILAEGTVRAAKRIGKGAARYVVSIKKMESFPMDPRSTIRGRGAAFVFGFIISTRGGDNVKSTHSLVPMYPLLRYPPDFANMTQAEYTRKFIEQSVDIPEDMKHRIFGDPPTINPISFDRVAASSIWTEDETYVLNSLGLCILRAAFLGATLISKLFTTCTGHDVDFSDLAKAGERILTLQRMYNAREGMTPRNDNWDQMRFYEEKVANGSGVGDVLFKETIQRTLEEYYDLREWSKESGLPTKGKLRKLGLKPHNG